MVLDMNRRRIEYYDSLGDCDPVTVGQVLYWLQVSYEHSGEPEYNTARGFRSMKNLPKTPTPRKLTVCVV